MSKIYKFNYHWLNELSKHKDMLDNDTRILVTYIEVLQQENKQLKEDKNKLRDYIVDQLKEYEKGIKDYKRYGIEDYTKGMAVGFKKCLEILRDEENE